MLLSMTFSPCHRLVQLKNKPLVSHKRLPVVHKQTPGNLLLIPLKVGRHCARLLC